MNTRYSIAKAVGGNNGVSYHCPVTKKISGLPWWRLFSHGRGGNNKGFYPTLENDRTMDNCLSAGARLLLLKRRHRALDEEISLLASNPWQNQLLLQRLKKEKLRIKDTIERLHSEMIPDIDA